MNVLLRKVFLSFVVFLTIAQAFGQSTFKKPALDNPNSWTLMLLPDPQTYNKFAKNQPVFELMTAWIADQAKTLNTKMVLCTGDLVEQNDVLNPDGINGDQPSKAQWEWVAQSFGRLDHRVPYIAATGNHDFGIKSAENRNTQYDKYFPGDKNPLSQMLLREVGIDHQGRPSLTNAAYEMVSPHGEKLLFMVLEFAPRDLVLKWALDVVNHKKYTDHKVILLTHSYINADSKHIEKEGYVLTDRNYGQAIWEKLVKPAKNIRMVLCGHIAKPDDIMAHIGFRTDMNAAGKPVAQMLFNAQALGGGWHGNGGDGWLRMLEFMPDKKSVKVKTFSPLFAFSPSTQHLAWRNAEYDEFVFTW